MNIEIEELTIERVHAAYRAGELTVRELVQSYLDRIRDLDRNGPALNSIVNLAEGALTVADVQDKHFAETGQFVGPLHGVPIVVKDQVETADVVTTFGSEAARDYLPSKDATAMTRLREAGAILLAKTTLPDFATSWFSTSSVSGVTKNPYDPTRDAGGSSSGSASAVAANLALVGLGEDTGGSIRLPASLCNLVGVRVTPGLVSRAGMSSLVASQDTAGPMTRTVADAARLLDVLVGFDADDPYTGAFVVGGQVRDYHASLPDHADLQGKRIGVLREVIPPHDDPEGGQVAHVVDEALAMLEKAGATLVDVEIPQLMDFVAFTSVYTTRSLQDMNRFLESRPAIGIESIQQLHADGSYHPKLDLLEAIAAGPATPSDDPEYANRLLAQGEFQRSVIAIMAADELDAIAFPDSRLAAPTHADVFADRWTCLTYPTNTVIASQLLFPAITVPAGFTSNDLPVGLELMGLPYSERALLGLAAGVEAATGARRAPRLTKEDSDADGAR